MELYLPPLRPRHPACQRKIKVAACAVQRNTAQHTSARRTLPLRMTCGKRLPAEHARHDRCTACWTLLLRKSLHTWQVQTGTAGAKGLYAGVKLRWQGLHVYAWHRTTTGPGQPWLAGATGQPQHVCWMLCCQGVRHAGVWTGSCTNQPRPHQHTCCTSCCMSATTSRRASSKSAEGCRASSNAWRAPSSSSRRALSICALIYCCCMLCLLLLYVLLCPLSSAAQLPCLTCSFLVDQMDVSFWSLSVASLF